jgi:hypothetical protein
MNEAPQGPYRVPATPEVPPPPVDALGWALVVTPAAGGLFAMLMPTADLSTVASIGTLIATVVMIGIDAKSRRMKGSRFVVGAVLLWLVFYPLYIHRRASFGAPKRLALALVSMLIYGGSGLFHPLIADDRALVTCVPTPALDGYTCTAKRESGDHAVNVCFDVVLTCEADMTIRTHECVYAPPRTSPSISVPLSSFPSIEECKKPSAVKLDRLVVTVSE